MPPEQSNLNLRRSKPTTIAYTIQRAVKTPMNFHIHRRYLLKEEREGGIYIYIYKSEGRVKESRTMFMRHVVLAYYEATSTLKHTAHY